MLKTLHSFPCSCTIDRVCLYCWDEALSEPKRSSWVLRILPVSYHSYHMRYHSYHIHTCQFRQYYKL